MHLIHRSYVLALCAALTLAFGAPRTLAAGPPRRIVSAFLCTDEYVFRLVPRTRIAALSYLAADTHPVVSTIAGQVAGIPLVRASAEEIMSLRPDLVVTYENTNLHLLAQLRAAGIPLLEIPWAQSLTDVRRITLMLGDRLNAREHASAMLATMDANLAMARSNAVKPPVRTLIYEPNGYLTAGGVSDAVLLAGGLQSIAPSMHVTRAGTLPVEALLAAPPDILILNDSPEAAPARANLLLRHPALSALKSMAVHLSLTPLLCPGPWSAAIAPKFAQLGHQARSLARPRPAP